MQLTTTPQGFNWCDSVSTLCIFVGDVLGEEGERGGGSTATFQLWCSVHWVSCLDFPELFLQPRAQLQLSTSLCVPHLESDRDVLIPHLVLHINKFTFGSGASMYSEMRPQRCQLQLSTSFLPRWHQGCVQSPVPAFAFKPCCSNDPSSSFGSQISVFRGV